MSDQYAIAVDSLAPAGVDAKYVQKRIPTIRVIDAFAARKVADGLEALILEASTPALAGIQSWPTTKGFEVFPEAVRRGAEGRVRVHLQLLESLYSDVFRALCEDVCELLAETESEHEAVRKFHRRLLRWRSFLDKHGPEGLSDQARCGLFGELLLLRDVLLPALGARAIAAWRGCRKAHQDFQFPDRAIEVKTTRAAIPDRVSVSNVQQLDSDAIEFMFVAVVHVHENESVGETLPELVESLRSGVPEDARDLLRDGLDEVGYSDAHRHLYLKARYQVLDTLYFEVKEDFPRLTRDSIPKGVKSVRYEIGLDSCRPFRAQEAIVLEKLKSGGDRW